MGELIQRFTYTCTCVSHVTGRRASIYKGRRKSIAWMQVFLEEDGNSTFAVRAT